MSQGKSSGNKKRGFRQSMSALHGWTGLLFGVVLYAMFLTGTLSYFKDELSQWMRPELAKQTTTLDSALVAQRMAEVFGDVPQWSIGMPDARNIAIDAFWRPSNESRRFERGYFNPKTGQAIEARETRGGDFFYRFHFQFHHLPVVWGRWLAGVAAMFMLIAIVSGVITHKKIFTDFFTFRWGKGQRSWLDGHNALSVFALPFHLMITYTGLVTLMALYMPWGQQIAIKTPAEQQELRMQLSAFVTARPASGEPAALASIETMVRQAQAHWGEEELSRITVTNPGDAAAQVFISRRQTSRISMSPQYLLFEGKSGKVAHINDQVGAAAEVRGVLYGLHLGRFSDSVTRWLYFTVSLLGTAMIGTGLVLWPIKRRQRLVATQSPSLLLRVVERLNIAGIAGLSIAITAFLWANRLLPFHLAERAAMEIQVFFIVWGLTLVHAILRPVGKAWREQLWIATVALTLLPIINAFTTSRPFWQSVMKGDWVFISADLLFWSFALLHGLLAWRVTKKQVLHSKQI